MRSPSRPNTCNAAFAWRLRIFLSPITLLLEAPTAVITSANTTINQPKMKAGSIRLSTPSQPAVQLGQYPEPGKVAAGGRIAVAVTGP